MGVYESCRFMAIVIATAGFATACSAGVPPDAAQSTTAPALSTSVGPSSKEADERALRNLYTQLVDALGRHDTTTQVALTCTRYQSGVESRADQDPMLNIDYFGKAEEVRQLGRDAATDKLYAALLPASKQAVEAVVDAIIDGDVARYQIAIKRLEREGTTTTLDKIDDIDIIGDTATVAGAYTMRAFTSPPRVVTGTNQAVRENGQWKDCTPVRQ